MSGRSKYLLDSDSLIRSKREHYAFDFCPAFWDALLLAYERDQLVSIEPIRDELLRGKDALADWIRDVVPDEFFEPISDEEVESAYKKVMAWSEGNKQYARAAKQKFASGADPWLIATAVARKYTLVTYEVSSSESKVLIKIPDVAKHLGVTCIPPFVMLRNLKVKFQLE